MPQANDIVIKNASSVNKTLTLISPAAGYGSLAEWKLKEGAIVGAFPTLTLLARKTGNRSQVSQVKFSMPSSYVDTTTSRTHIGVAAQMNATFSMPDEFPESSRDDFAAYCGEIVKDAIIQASLRDGHPAT